MDSEKELRLKLTDVEQRLERLTQALGRVTGERDEILRQLIDVEGAESSRYVGAR
jgi:hypothetical protein